MPNEIKVGAKPFLSRKVGAQGWNHYSKQVGCPSVIYIYNIAVMKSDCVLIVASL